MSKPQSRMNTTKTTKPMKRRLLDDQLQMGISIIQTRGMKAKNLGKSNKDIEDEIVLLNNIDKLTQSEILDGDRVVNGEDGSIGDGVDLSIDGAELDEDFPESVDG